MFEIKKGSLVPPIPTKSTFYSKCSEMVPGDYGAVNFKTLDDCKRHQKIARQAVVRNGYNLATRIDVREFVLEIWCTAKPDPFFGEV